MILMKDIIREGNELLRKKSTNVEKPVNEKNKKILIEMIGYLINSQNDEKAKELGLRPGVGLAAPQIGINKKMFAIFTSDLEGKMWFLPVVNPNIIKRSKEMIYLPGGEGCLSVDRETFGVTPRHKKITVEGDFYDLKNDKFEHKKIDLEGYIAIVFQHEYDHLFGVLYCDNIMPLDEAKEKGYEPLWEIDEN